LLAGVASRARQRRLLIHTHASEQRDEVAAVRQRVGAPNIRALADLGLAGTRVCLAHCVWPEPAEIDLLASSGTNVVHCPSANLKLASGIAPIADYLARGINVSLGADGSAANNRLDGWEELRLAALLGRLRNGAEALPARRVFEMATLGGARALGLDHEIGSLEPGKQADLAVLDLRAPHSFGVEDVYTQLVFSARASDVHTVLVGGRVLVAEGALCAVDPPALLAQAQEHRARLVAAML
jgi:5-methylthioadenosine/S-adenosylhomocysteine deaminase